MPTSYRERTQESPERTASPLRPLRILLLGKDKPVVSRGLEFLVERGHEVVAVVGPARREGARKQLVDRAAELGIPAVKDDAIYDALEGRADPDSLPFGLGEVDLVISLLFWKRIRKPLIQLPRMGCINFHPAPLPDFRGVGGYNVAILEGLASWGASAHFVEEAFDTGALIEVRRFPIDAARETAFTLEQKTLRLLLEIFQDTVDKAHQERKLIGCTQAGGGRYISKSDFERMRQIQPDDTAEVVSRKIRAFWFPPHAGAAIVINGREYTVVDQNILQRVAAQGSA